MVPPSFMAAVLGTVRVKFASLPLVLTSPSSHSPFETTHCRSMSELGSTLSSTECITLEPAVTCAVNLTADPAWTVPVLTRFSTTVSGGGGVGVLDGLGAGVPGVVVGVADEDAVGAADGDVVAAIAADAVPLTRTSPEPTPMIIGLRTDRASTACNLLNDRLRH